jgi:pimeloyl-ACP methyl ester carboxylesterase
MPHVSSDGISIAFDDRPGDEPVVLCLPGWCANRDAFDGLTLRNRMIALDWRGHGGSAECPSDFGRAELVRDALAVIEASGARTIVPVATAHAGWVAIELRRQLGASRVPKLVLVDWIVGPAPPPFLEGLAALQDPRRWQGARDHLFTMWTHGVSEQRVLDFVHKGMGRYGAEMWHRGGREISAAYAEAGSPLSALSALSPPPPTLHLFARSPSPAATEAQRAFAAAHAWFTPVELDGLRSHFPTIEAPERVSAEIERFLSR